MLSLSLSALCTFSLIRSFTLRCLNNDSATSNYESFNSYNKTAREYVGRSRIGCWWSYVFDLHDGAIAPMIVYLILDLWKMLTALDYTDLEPWVICLDYIYWSQVMSTHSPQWFMYCMQLICLGFIINLFNLLRPCKSVWYRTHNT